MSQRYPHITQKERHQIHAYHKAPFSIPAVAPSLNRHQSTIRRELNAKEGWKLPPLQT